MAVMGTETDFSPSSLMYMVHALDMMHEETEGRPAVCCVNNGYSEESYFIAAATSSSGRDIVPVENTVNLNQQQYLPSDLRTYVEEALPEEDWGNSALLKKEKISADLDVVKSFEMELNKMADPLAKLLQEHQMAFAEFGGLGCVEGAEHEILIKSGANPVRSRPYRLSWEEDEYLRNELDRMYEMGIIRPSTGKWTSPIFFIKKKDGSLRLVVDYRQLNARTVTQDYPLPHIHDLLDGFQGARWFTLVDACSGFTQIPMAAGSTEYTGFICKYGTWEYTRMPFGCQGGPATFSREMARILGKHIGECFQVFIDDICVFSKTFEEHLEHLALLSRLCEAANLKLKWSKCAFAKNEIEYLGYKLDQDGISPTKKNVDKLLKMTEPSGVAGVRSFLATAGFYRRSIKDFAKVALPLTNLLKKDANFHWGTEEQSAFDTLKARLTEAPVMAYPDPNQVQILTTDGSSKGLGVILSQSPDGSSEGETVVAYASRTLRGPERKYSATHVEAFAVVWGVHYFRHYLAGREFVLNSDHSSLKFIFENPNPSPKIHRWAAAMMSFNYKLVHRKGSENPADSLSRLVS